MQNAAVSDRSRSPRKQSLGVAPAERLAAYCMKLPSDHLGDERYVLIIDQIVDSLLASTWVTGPEPACSSGASAPAEASTSRVCRSTVRSVCN